MLLTLSSQYSSCRSWTSRSRAWPAFASGAPLRSPGLVALGFARARIGSYHLGAAVKMSA